MPNTPTPKTWDEALDEILDEFATKAVLGKGDYKSFKHNAKSALNNAVKEKEALAYEQGLKDGVHEVWNESMYYLAETKRKTIPISWMNHYAPQPPLPEEQRNIVDGVTNENLPPEKKEHKTFEFGGLFRRKQSTSGGRMTTPTEELRALIASKLPDNYEDELDEIMQAISQQPTEPSLEDYFDALPQFALFKLSNGQYTTECEAPFTLNGEWVHSKNCAPKTSEDDCYCTDIMDIKNYDTATQAAKALHDKLIEEGVIDG